MADTITHKVKSAKSDYQIMMSNITKLENEKQSDQSVLSKLNEFSQYNELEYYFKLEKEEVREFFAIDEMYASCFLGSST